MSGQDPEAGAAPVGGTDALVGDWYRSYEEEDGAPVYRPASFDFPPARAPRPLLQLAPDGTAVLGSPGPDDRNLGRPGTWRSDGLRVSVDEADASLTFELGTTGPGGPVLRATSPRGPDHADHDEEEG